MRPTRQSLTKRFAIPERTMVERNETEPWKKERGRGLKPRSSRRAAGSHGFQTFFVSLRGHSAAVAIFKPKVWHPVAKHGVPARRISNIWEIKMAGFIAKPAIFVSLRGRSAAVAILKFEAWHPVAKHGSTKQEEIPITKNRRFAASFRFLALPSKALFRSVQP